MKVVFLLAKKNSLKIQDIEEKKTNGFKFLEDRSQDVIKNTGGFFYQEAWLLAPIKREKGISIHSH